LWALQETGGKKSSGRGGEPSGETAFDKLTGYGEKGCDPNQKKEFTVRREKNTIYPSVEEKTTCGRDGLNGGSFHYLKIPEGSGRRERMTAVRASQKLCWHDQEAAKKRKKGGLHFEMGGEEKGDAKYKLSSHFYRWRGIASWPKMFTVNWGGGRASSI